LGIPSYGTQTLNVAVGQSLNGDFNSAAMEVIGFDMAAIQAVWSGANGVKGKIVPQASLDNVNWCDMVAISDSRLVNAATGCLMYAFDFIPYDFLRVAFIANGNTAGTMTVTIRAKKRIA